MVSTAWSPPAFGESELLELRERRIAPRITLAGVRVDALDFRTVLNSIVEHILSDGPTSYVVTPNAHHVVLHQNDELLREIYEHAFLVVTDGVPLLWAARLLGHKLYGRINGTDLCEQLCAEAARRGLRVYFLGGREGAADAAAALLRERHPALNVCGTYCPRFGFERDAAEQAKIVDHINSRRPDLVFVGLGAPKQEYWMYANRTKLQVPMLLGIGVSFELVSGLVRRAPVWMQHSGLEWLFRLLMEPRRLWRRYLVGNAAFCILIACEYISKMATRLAV